MGLGWNQVICVNCTHVGPPPPEPALSCCPERKAVTIGELCDHRTRAIVAESKLDKTLRLLAESERRMNDPAWRSAVWEALGHPGNNPAQPFGKRE